MSTRDIAEQVIGESDILLQGPGWIETLIARIDAALTKAIADERATPIPMVLHCPNCSEQHIDQPESETSFRHRMEAFAIVAEPQDRFPSRWTNPPHKSHLCHNCGIIWRPADVVTTGVESIQTRGKEDTWAIRRDDTADTQTEDEKHQ
jgi:predicted RNA-binding Zn-ribbon protein involved in translation (DUF1610 family)